MHPSSVVCVFATALLLGPIAPEVAFAAWPQFGRALSATPSVQRGPTSVPDGAGGAIVTWVDLRSPPVFIYAQHVLATGEVDAGWPPNGRPLLTNPLAFTDPLETQGSASIVSDGAGGAVVAWEDGPTTGNERDIYAQHVKASGAVDGGWPANGRALCVANGLQGSPRIVSDGVGGAIVTWQDGRNAPGDLADIFAQHILASGVVDPNWPVNGVALCTAPRAQIGPRIIEDGLGGAIVAWFDARSTVTGEDVYAQHLLGSGAVDPAWPVNGLALCTAPGTQVASGIATDGTHGAIVTWSDARDGISHIYAQRVLPSGAIAPGWPINGRAVSTSGADERSPDLVSDGAGGAVISWEFAREVRHNMRAQHVLASGILDPAWPDSGVALSVADTTEQDHAAIASDGAGAAIVTWQNNVVDIFAQHVLASGALDPAFPRQGRPVCTLPSEQKNPTIVAAGPGGAIVTWMDSRNGDNANVFALQVVQTGTVGVADPPSPPEIRFAAPSPSPAFGPVTLRFALPRQARVRLAIYNVTGRRVRELVFGLEPAGEHSTAWDLRDENGRAVGSGIYFARFETEGRTFTHKFMTLK